MSREHALVRAALGAAAELVDDQLYSGLAELIRSLDPAAIVCPSPFGEDDGTAADCIRRGHCGCNNDPAAVAATVPVVADKRDAELTALRAENEHLRHVNMGKVSLELYEAATHELRARVTELEKDTEQLRALMRTHRKRGAQ